MPLSVVTFITYILETETLVNSMPKLADNDQEDRTAIYDVYTALAIGIASEKAADNPEFADDENSRPSTSETFEQAYRWFLSRLEGGHFTPDFVSKFVSLATCLLECSPLREASCNVVAELGERLKAYADEHLDGEAEAAMRKKLANMNKADIEAIKYCIAEPGLQVVNEADEDEEEVVEAVMRTAVDEMTPKSDYLYITNLPNSNKLCKNKNNRFTFISKVKQTKRTVMVALFLPFPLWMAPSYRDCFPCRGRPASLQVMLVAVVSACRLRLSVETRWHSVHRRMCLFLFDQGRGIPVDGLACIRLWVALVHWDQLLFGL